MVRRSAPYSLSAVAGVFWMVIHGGRVLSVAAGPTTGTRQPEQQRRGIVLHRPRQQELVQFLRFQRSGRPPAQILCSRPRMLGTGLGAPAIRTDLDRIHPKLLGEPGHRHRRRRRQPVRHEPQPRQRAQRDRQPQPIRRPPATNPDPQHADQPHRQPSQAPTAQPRTPNTKPPALPGRYAISGRYYGDPGFRNRQSEQVTIPDLIIVACRSECCGSSSSTSTPSQPVADPRCGNASTTRTTAHPARLRRERDRIRRSAEKYSNTGGIQLFRP